MPNPTPAEPIRDIRHIRAIKSMLKADDRRIEHLYFTIAINSGLRVGDMLELTIDDLWDAGESPRKEFSRHTNKTGAYIITQINDAVLESMRFAKPVLPMHDPDARLFKITRQTVSNWIKRWCHAIGMDQGNFSAHSTRKTCAYQMWAMKGKTQEALFVVSRALGHKSISQTVTYLGIDRESIREWQHELNL